MAISVPRCHGEAYWIRFMIWKIVVGPGVLAIQHVTRPNTRMRAHPVLARKAATSNAPVASFFFSLIVGIHALFKMRQRKQLSDVVASGEKHIAWHVSVRSRREAHSTDVTTHTSRYCVNTSAGEHAAHQPSPEHGVAAATPLIEDGVVGPLVVYIRDGGIRVRGTKGAQWLESSGFAAPFGVSEVRTICANLVADALDLAP
mmetsp:Transcript_26191/g.68016  ORF Transcript_26191/g.68016 Transcript_26191/m.68016 type:complete len:202 (-) Transcript_26191:270-875(-)